MTVYISHAVRKMRAHVTLNEFPFPQGCVSVKRENIVTLVANLDFKDYFPSS